MIQFALRILLNGLLLSLLLPGLFSGITFHGSFWPEGVVAGLLFAVVVWLVEVLLRVFGVLTLGLGWLLRCMFWFLVPALQLWAMASWFPQYLTIHSAGAAIFGGLVLMIVNVVTSTNAMGGRRGEDD